MRLDPQFDEESIPHLTNVERFPKTCDIIVRDKGEKAIGKELESKLTLSNSSCQVVMLCLFFSNRAGFLNKFSGFQP